MPPVVPGPQGSRAGLITALVIFVILWVTATVVAIHFNADLQKSEAIKKEELDRYKPYISEQAMSNPKIVALKDLATKTPGKTAIELAIDQRDTLVKPIGGTTDGSLADGLVADVSRTVKESKDQLASSKAQVDLSEDNLLGDIRVLTNKIAALTEQANAAEAAKAAAEAKINAANAERDAALAAKDKEIAAANAKVADTDAASKKREGDIGTNIADIQKNTSDKITANEGNLAATTTELEKVKGQLKKTRDDLGKCEEILKRYRVNPNRRLLRSAGMITRAPGDGTVFINLGYGSEVFPGLTFEVYDKKKGLPSLTTANPEAPDQLPNGKGSIEIVRILDSGAECRVIRSTTPIVEGDLILNLIYNTHTRFTFAIYGDFDLANNGQASPGDIDVLRRLVTQWGGKVSDTISVDTDFLVLGADPKVQALPESPTAADQEKHEKQLAAKAAYDEKLSDAVKLGVPILNQNRFLFFSGYYDQARR